MNVVLIEDHDDLREMTANALKARGHRVREFNCAEAFSEEPIGLIADFFIIDLTLPGEDGLSLSRRLRDTNPDIGIIILTARDKTNDIAMGYRSGADIYLVKPTSIEAIEAALQALQRRTMRQDTASVANYTLVRRTRMLRGPVADVGLSSVEYTLLAALAQAPDRILESWQLIELAGKSASDEAKRTLEVQIARLRKRLEQVGASAPTVKAIRGMGYQLCIPITIRRVG